MKTVNFNYESNLNVADSLVIYSIMIHFIFLNINFLQCEGLSSLTSTKRSKIFMLTTETSETSENTTTTTELSTKAQNTNGTKDEWNNYDERCLWKPAVILPATTKHLSTVIFLHGIGESADHWAQILEYSRQPSMKVICPNENLTQIKNIQRNQMDTTHFNIGPINTENEECLNKSTKYVHSLITDEIKRGIKPENIIVGGFSQGGAIAIQSVFTYPKKLGGVIAMSTWIPMPHLFFRDFILSNTDIPIFHGYGDLDHMVPYHVSNFTALCFNKMSMNTVSKIYRGVKHDVPMEKKSNITIIVAPVETREYGPMCWDFPTHIYDIRGNTYKSRNMKQFFIGPNWSSKRSHSLLLVSKIGQPNLTLSSQAWEGIADIGDFLNKVKLKVN